MVGTARVWSTGLGANALERGAGATKRKARRVDTPQMIGACWLPSNTLAPDVSLSLDRLLVHASFLPGMHWTLSTVSLVQLVRSPRSLHSFALVVAKQQLLGLQMRF